MSNTTGKWLTHVHYPHSVPVSSVLLPQQEYMPTYLLYLLLIKLQGNQNISNYLRGVDNGSELYNSFHPQVRHSKGTTLYNMQPV